MSDDVYLNYFGHPLLPAGFNADDNNGDYVDGPGTNWPVWPVLFDTFVGIPIVILTQEMMDVFEDACPDYVAPCVSDTIVFPTEVRTQPIRRRA